MVAFGAHSRGMRAGGDMTSKIGDFTRRAFVAGAGGALLPGVAAGQVANVVADQSLGPAVRTKVTRQIPRSEIDGQHWFNIPGFKDIVDDPTFVPKTVCGLRPERRVNGVSTVRLESEPPTGARALIVHNYGHCGSGVTLGLGCASLVEQWLSGPKQQSKDAKIVIVGAGIIGLSMAYVLKSRGYRNVAIRARVVSSGNFDGARTVSDIAGGQFDAAGVSRIGGNIIPELGKPGNQLQQALRETLTTLTERRGQANDQFAVRGSKSLYIYTVARNYTINPYEVPDGLDDASDLVHANSVLNAALVKTYGSVLPTGGDEGVVAPFTELQETRANDEPIRFGVRDTILVNTPNLISNILAYLRTSIDGPRVAMVVGAEGTINTHDELKAIDADVVINCTGLGGAVIGADAPGALMHGRYGLLARLDRLGSSFGANAPRYLYSGLGYMFPRSDGTIVGGAWGLNQAEADAAMPVEQIAVLPASEQAKYFSSLLVPGADDRKRAADMVHTVGAFFLGRTRKLARLEPVVSPWLNGSKHFACSKNRMACPGRVRTARLGA